MLRVSRFFYLFVFIAVRSKFRRAGLRIFPGSVARTACLTIHTNRITGVATGLRSIKTMSFVRSKELGATPEILKEIVQKVGVMAPDVRRELNKDA
jgi:hypothetical protein